MMMHDRDHIVHDLGGMRELAQQGATYDVITDILHFRPQRLPDFLQRT